MKRSEYEEKMAALTEAAKRNNRRPWQAVAMIGLAAAIIITATVWAGDHSTQLEIRNGAGVVKAIIQARSDNKDGIEITNRAGTVLQRIP